MLKRICIISALLIIAHTAFSEKVKSKFYPGCHEVGHRFVDNQLVLEPLKVEDYDQTVFFIHNVSSDNLVLRYVPTTRDDIFPLWQTEIDSNRWAAFATDRTGMRFSCSSIYDDYKINCQQALEVCQYPRAKFAAHNKGNYWLSGNKFKYPTRSEVIHKGVLLRGYNPNTLATEESKAKEKTTQ